MVMTKSSRAMINLIRTLGSFLSQTHRSQEGARMVSEHLLPWASKTTPKSTNYLAIALILLSPMVLMDVSQAAGRVFHDDFESYGIGTLPQAAWVAEPGRSMSDVMGTATDGGAPHGGVRQACARFVGTTFDTFTKSFTTLYSDEFLIRVWIRFDNNFDNAPPGASGVHLLRFFEVGGYDWLHAMVDPTWYTVAYQLNGSLIGNTGSLVLPGHTWHKHEMYFKKSTGVMKDWQDGVLKKSESGIAFGSFRWNVLFMMSNWGSGGAGPDASNDTYFDDFEFYSDLGTGGTGLMSDATITQGGGGVSDTTSPAVPVNLRIQ
jgi:hypothetical protein